jgi:hypothetical protein
MIRTLLMIGALLMTGTISTGATAQSADGYAAQSDSPLMVIRFNQQRVYYDRQLYTAATKALEIKPSVRFSVVSFVPQFGSDNEKKALMNSAVAQTNKLVSELQQMGLPKDRIAVSREIVGDSRHHEIYLYVD